MMLKKYAMVPWLVAVLVLMFSVYAFATTDLAADDKSEINSIDIQKALTAAGYYQGPVDGVIGSKTKAAIRAFQEANDLKVDGKVGPKTWAKLEAHLNVKPVETASEVVPEPEPAEEAMTPTLDESTDYSYSEFGTDDTSDDTQGELKQKLVS